MYPGVFFPRDNETKIQKYLLSYIFENQIGTWSYSELSVVQFFTSQQGKQVQNTVLILSHSVLSIRDFQRNRTNRTYIGITHKHASAHTHRVFMIRNRPTKLWKLISFNICSQQAGDPGQSIIYVQSEYW